MGWEQNSTGQSIRQRMCRGGPQGVVVGKQLDLADLKSVDRFVKELKAEPRIDYLILNAGISTPQLLHDERGWENHIATNHYGHYALVQGLLPKLKAQVCGNSFMSFVHHQGMPLPSGLLAHFHISC